MLAEAICEKKVVAYIMGIGININETEFKGELKDKATSLKILLGSDFDIKTILDEFIINFDYLYEEYKSGNYSFIKDVRKKNY